MTSTPKTKSKYDFRTCLTKSEVLEPDVLIAWLRDHADDSPHDQASQLVRQNLLTPWQAKYLLSGRYRLHLGNYQLLERIRRDDFGDRFFALHPQLGRKVLVQVLPAELTGDEQRRSEFLKQASQAGKLDHPNLAHVLDIDRQQGRYYLVTEHIDGTLLANIRAESFDASTIAQLVRDAISGLHYAHSNGVTHGHLSPSSILIGDDGAVKVTQLALAPLADANSKGSSEQALASSEQALATADLKQVIQLGQTMLKACGTNEASDQVAAILNRMQVQVSDQSAEPTTEPTELVVLTELNDWIDDQQADPAPVVIDTAVPSSPPPLDDEPTAFPTQLVEKNASRPDASRTAAAKPVTSKRSLLSVSLLSLLAVGIGLAGYFLYPSAPQPLTQTAAREPANLADQETLDLGTSSGNTTPTQRPVQTNQAADDTKPRTLAPKSTRADSTSELPPSNAEAKVSDQLSGRSSTTAKANVKSEIVPFPGPRHVSDGELATEAKVEPSIKAYRETAHKTAPQAASQPIVESATVVIAETTTEPKPTDAGNSLGLQEEAEPAKPVKQEVDASPDKPAAKGESEPSEPFDNFPTSAELPPSDSNSDATVVQLQGLSTHLLGLELISPVGVGRGRTAFAIERNEATKVQWSLLAKKNPRQQGDPVGRFDFDQSSGKLSFRWLDAAADSKIANYVRNCAIKLTLANESRTLALRKPVGLPQLKLTRDQPFAKVELDIPWLPNPERITVEILPFKSAGLPKTWVEPAIIRPSEPSAIHFYEAKSKRFLWLQLDYDIRNKANFQLRLLLKHADGSVAPIAKSKDVKGIVALLKQASATAEQNYLANLGVEAPHGKKTKFKEYVAKLKSTKIKTENQTDTAIENVGIVGNLYDRVIPIRMIFRSEGHTVVLVDTAPTLDKDSNDGG